MIRRAGLAAVLLALVPATPATGAPDFPGPNRPPSLDARMSTLGDEKPMSLRTYSARGPRGSEGGFIFGGSKRLAFAPREPITGRLDHSAARVTLRTVRFERRDRQVLEKRRTRPEPGSRRRVFDGTLRGSLDEADAIVLAVVYARDDRPRYGRNLRVTRAKFEIGVAAPEPGARR